MCVGGGMAKRLGPGRLAPAKKGSEKKDRSAINKVVTRE